MFGKKKRNGNNPRNDKPGKGKKKADFGIEPLEKRVLMSASWVDADSGDAQDGPTHEADTFHGSDMADTANGGNGNDILFGNGGNDILSGSHGNDQLYGGDGNDTLDGGTGEDQLFGGSGDDVLQGGDQQDHLVGGDGNDTLDGGTDNDNLIGGSGHDNLIGGHGDDYLDGGSGNDTLDGGTGHDTIIGGDGDDTITGDHGDDVITGGKGNDTIDAGTGNDVINYTVGDGSDVVIGDWGTDRIEINGDASSASHVLVEDAPTYTARTGDVVDADRVVISVNGVKSIEAHGIEEVQFNSAHEGDTIETSGVLTSVGLSESNVTIVDPPEPENTAPTDLTFTGGSVTENAEAGTLVAVVSAVDADSDDVHAYELIDDAGGRFEIDSATGEITVADGAQLNHEAAGSHSVTVRVTDSDGAEYEESLSIGVTDANEAPTDLVFSSGNPDFVLSGEQVAEALPEGATATEYTVSGVPEGASLSAGSQNDDGTWTVSADQVDGLRVVNADPTSAIGLTLSADVVGSESVTTTITASNVRDTDAGFTVTARSITNDGQLTEASADNVVTSGGSFAVNGGTGGPSSQIGYDASKGISEELVVSFDTPMTSVQASISRLFTDEAGSCEQGEWVAYRDGVEVASSIFIATQNNAATLDIDAGGEEFDQVVFRATEYTGGQNGKTSDSSDYMVDSITFDREVTTVTHYDIPVTIEAEWGEADTATVVENAPAGTVVATMSVSDPDAGDTHSFELVGNADGRFEIDAATGAISVAEGAELDHESADAHELTVRVTDANGQTYDEVLSISVTDSNEAPTDLELSNTTVAENAEAGTVVGSISVTDQDAGETHTFELTHDAGGRFEVDSDGNIVVAEGAELDYEAASEHEVTVRVTDSVGSTYEQAVSIEVADVNEAPTVLSITGGTVSENAAGGTFVASASVNDPDANDSHTYELTDDAGGRFVIDQDGDITVADGADLNYESETSHQITVKVTDENGETIEDVLEVSVANVMETLVVSGNETLTAADGPFEHVVINGGYIEIDGDAVIEGDLTITSAARINGGEISVAGNVTTTDTNYHGSAMIVLSGDGAQSISTGDGSGELHNVSITNTSGQVTIEGQLEISGSYTDNGNAVDATGATVELQGNASVSGEGTSFGDVTIDGGYFEISEMHVDGDLTLESAARINGGEISVTGNVTTTDTNYHGSAMIVLSGDGAQTISTGDGAGELHNVSITNTSGQVAIEGDLQISGSYTDNGNTVDATGATVELQGNASVSGAGTSFGDVTIDGGYFEISEMHVDGDLNLESAARINGGEISVAGNVTTTDTNYHGSASIVLSGDGAQSISTGDGAGELHNVSITNTSGQVAIEGDLQISGSYTDNGNTVDATGATVELQGNASVSGAGTSFGDVTLDGGYFEISEMHVDGDLNLESAARINGGEISVTGNVTTTDTNYHGSATIVLSGDGAQSISTGDGAGELHNVSITNTSGQVAIEGDLQISGSYTDNGNTVDATGATVELQGNASVSGAGTSFGDLVINGGYMELDGDIYVNGDVTVENLARLNGGVIYVAGEIIDNDGNWHGTGDIRPWITNEAPSDLTFEGGSVNENAAAGTVVATAAVIDADVEDSHSYELVNDADGRFEIDAQTGVITVADGAELDHESADAHEVTVRVTDSHGETYEEALNIAVADVNEAPTAIMLDAEVADTNVLKVTIGGQRGGSGGSTGAPNYQIVVDGQVVKSGTADWMDMTRFSEQDSTDRWHELSIELPGDTSPDQVEVRFTNDSWGGSSETDRNLYVDNIQVNGQTFEAESDETQYNRGNNSIGGQEGMYWNGSLQFNTSEAPDPLHAVVSENAAGAVIGQLGVIDPDANDEAGYAVSDARFEVTTEGVLKLRDGVTLDHEAGSVVEVEVIGTDSAGNEIDATFRIGVADVNDTPDAIAFTGGSVSENAEAGTPVASVSVMDQDAGDSHTYELTDDAGGRFTIDAEGNIAVAEGADLDHESAASHEVTVQATDSAGNTIEQTLTIEVGDVNETPDALAFTGGIVQENAPVGTVVATVSVSDVDASDTHTYELVENADGRFVIDGSGNIVLAEGGSLDYESASSHQVTVRVTDSGGNSIEQSIDIEVSDVNENQESMTFTGGNVTENAPSGTVVASANVIDPDAGDTQSYELTDDAGGRFTIDAEGNITVAEGADLDHESAVSHEVTVQATDSAGNTIEQTLTIEVGNVNEAPESISFEGGSVAENASAGTVVATASVSDVDAGDTHTYELTDDAGGRFTIDAEGNIIVGEGANLDHESGAAHQVTVKVTDSAGHTIERGISIEVADVNEAMESLTFSGGTIAEDAQAGTIVASASVTDPDAGETFSYELTDDADGRFTIDADGNIVVSTDGALDFESAKSHEVTVRVTDSAGHTIERTLTIEITNINEPTSEVADSEEAVQEQQATSAEPVQFEMQSDSAADGSTQADRSEFEPANYAAQTGEAFEMQAAADTLKWVAAEVDEINELAKSVDAADIHFSDSTASGGQASFEEVFARSNGPDEIDEPTGMAEEPPEYERASDGFIGKFWTMLRAGFGTTNRADESQAAGVQNDKALRNRSRQK